MTKYAPVPKMQGGCCCATKPPVADDFSPGSYARVAANPVGMGDGTRRVDSRGLPPILRMGKLAGFLGAMGDDGLDLVGMDTGSFVDASPVYLPQIENNTGFLNIPFVGLDPNSPLLDFSSSPTGTLQIPKPTNIAQIPNNVQSVPVSQPGTSVPASIINAGSSILKAATGQTSPASTMTPAQLAALKQQQTLNASGTPLIPGVNNSDLLMLGAAAALFAILVSQK
jgi:hypothetical protein